MKNLTKEKQAKVTQALIAERRCFGHFGEYEECRPGECKDYENLYKRTHRLLQRHRSLTAERKRGAEEGAIMPDENDQKEFMDYE